MNMSKKCDTATKMPENHTTGTQRVSPKVILRFHFST